MSLAPPNVAPQRAGREVRVSAPERLLLVPRATSETPESALIVPELRREVSYFLCLVDAGSIEEHAVVLLDEDDRALQDLLRRALNARRPRKVSFWKGETERWIPLEPPSTASVAAGLVCAHLESGFDPGAEARITTEGLLRVVTFR